jgi:hypothetical protein
MLDADLLTLLRDCYLPTSRNIVDAKLVRSATLTLDADAPGATVPGVPVRFLAHIEIYAPSANANQDEPANAQLLAVIENRLLGVQAISRVQITLLPALFPILC